MRWHFVGIDKTYIWCEGFEKIPTDNRDISQRSNGTGGNMEPITSWNQSEFQIHQILYLKKAIMEKSQYI